MSLAILKQNSAILLEVAENYEKILEKRKTAQNKEDIEKDDLYIKNFKNQFLYLLTGLHKLIQEEKNAK